MADVSQKFAGLPLGLLVCSPIVEVAKGQAELCRVYLDYVFKLAWKDGKQDGETNIVKFTLNRPYTDGAGNISQEPTEISAPLLSLVPVPAFTMEEATVQFTMEVKEQIADTSSSTSEGKFDFGASYFGFTAKISGSVTTQRSNTRTTDQSAKYDIFARAVQQPPAEGMAKLTTIFASVIEPISVGSAK